MTKDMVGVTHPCNSNIIIKYVEPGMLNSILDSVSYRRE